MDKTKALQKLLNGTAAEEEIELLRQSLASGEISIGGDMNRSVVIIGSGNKVELTAEALGILKPETKTEEPVEGEPPYMGLRYFDTSDVDLFYGRESLTRELLARVQKESFLAIVGASGSGKSSVARAGLIPAWKQENERSAIHVITPTAHPLESLAASLTRDSESVTATSILMDDLKNDSRSLRLYVKKMLGETKLLLLVDQFEETFTLCKDAVERNAFIENLISLADDSARVVITLRADFYHHCAEYEGLRLVLEKHQAFIGAMTQDELREAIIAPAQKNSWEIQPGLVDLILQDLGEEPGALPLLSHALLETWRRRQGRMMTLHGYADAGGVKKAIAQTAESVYNRLTSTEQAIARGIFLRLIELGDGAQDTRRRVKMDELLHQTQSRDVAAKVLKDLVDVRLITTEKDSAEMAHEALIRYWERMRNWSEENRRFLIWRQKLTDRYLDWQKNKGDLLQGSYLIEAENWLLVQESQFSAGEKKYIEESIFYRIKRQKLLSNINFGFISSYMVLAVLVGVIGVYITTRVVTGSLSERLTNQLLEAGRVVSDSFVRQEGQHINEAQRISYTVGLAEALQAEDKEAVLKLVEPAFSAGTVENIILISSDGNEIVHLFRDETRAIQRIKENSGAANSPIVAPFLKNRKPADPPRRALGVNLFNNELYYYTAQPIAADNEFYGVIVVGTSLQTLLPVFKRVALADVVLYGNNGQALATTVGSADEETLKFLSISEEDYHSVLVAPGQISGTNFELAGRNYILGRAPLQIGNDRIGVFGVALPSDFVTQFGSSNRTTYATFFTIVFLLVISIGFTVWQAIIKPLYSSEKTNQSLEKKSDGKKREWLLFLLVVPIGILMILIAAQMAIHSEPTWTINTGMGSNLDSVEYTPIGNVQPILPDILTPIAWSETFLTPNSEIEYPVFVEFDDNLSPMLPHSNETPTPTLKAEASYFTDGVTSSPTIPTGSP